MHAISVVAEPLVISAKDCKIDFIFKIGPLPLYIAKLFTI